MVERRSVAIDRYSAAVMPNGRTDHTETRDAHLQRFTSKRGALGIVRQSHGNLEEKKSQEVRRRVAFR